MKRTLNVGDKVIFHSGNFAGLTGIITHLDWESTDPRAIYGFLHTVELSDGRTGYIEKSEHWEREAK
jgi:transcription antitermination factor NusG